MYRVIKMGSKVFAIKIDIEMDLENIKEFVDSGDVVMLSYDLGLVSDLLSIEEDEIEIVL